MKHDITGRADIELLINSFYDTVRQDKTIGFIFNEVIGDDWSHHLPVMYNFWESVLFSKPGYQGNPIKKHIEMDKKIPLLNEHFNRWMELWHETLDAHFAGEVTELAKDRAMLMANLINMKVDMARYNSFIQ